MTDTIKNLCEKNKITIKGLEQSLGFGDGTIRKWDKNSPSINRVEAVAQYFGVSLDYIVYGPSLPGPGKTSAFTDEEQLLIGAFRQLNEKGQAKALEHVKLLLLDPDNKPVKPAKLAVENLAEAM